MSGYYLFFIPGDTWQLPLEDLQRQLAAMRAWDRLYRVYGDAA